VTLSTIKSTTAFRARPFLKWAGGKAQLLSQFQHYYPDRLAGNSVTRYIEPFLGAGAVFLDIIQKFPISSAFLFDVNKELILAFQVVQRRPADLLAHLQVHKQKYLLLNEVQRSKYYYEVRDAYNAQRLNFNYAKFSDDWIIRAAKMIFLNKTCFNGLYRVNSKGDFNVPCGRYERPGIFDEENILSVSQLLQDATLRVGSFEECKRFINDESFVYFDPPYRPISSTSSFTSYSKKIFVDEDQVKLAQFFAHIDATSGADLMLSNSDPQNINAQDTFFEELYAKFKIHKVFASRMISSQAQGRGKISELLITNY
jgi:DNA adenine methylase